MNSNADSGAADAPGRRARRDVTGWVPEFRDAVEPIPADASQAEVLNALELFHVRRAALDVARADMVARLWETGTHSSSENEELVRELSLIFSISNMAAVRLVTTSLLIHDSAPARAAVESGRITLVQAEAIAEGAPKVAPEDRDRFGTEAIQLVEGVSGATARDRVRQLVDLMTPEGMTERHEAAKGTRRVQLEPAGDGMAWLMLLLEAQDAVAIKGRLDRQAVLLHGDPGEERCIAELRADVAVDLLLAGGAAATEADVVAGVRKTGRAVEIVPQVHVMVPVMALLGGAAPAHLRGYGPIDPVTARQLTSEAPSLYRVLVDPVKSTVLDVGREHYEVPAALRRYLAIRDERCRFPGCRRSADLCDLDHVKPWADDGQTAADNLAHLCRRHHHVKDQGWTVEIDPDGTMRWTSPYGRTRVTRPAAIIRRDEPDQSDQDVAA